MQAYVRIEVITIHTAMSCEENIAAVESL